MHQLRTVEYFSAAHLPFTVFRGQNHDNERHCHEFLEMVLVVEGRAQHHHYSPQSDVPHCYEIRHNDLFLVPLGWSHNYVATENFCLYNILFQPSLLEETGDLIEAAPRPLQLLAGEPATRADEITHKVHLRAGERELIETLLRECSREITLRRSGFELVARAKMVEVLVSIARIAVARATGNTSMPVTEAGSPVANAATFMEEHFSDYITLEDIASAVHLNANYLCEVFKSTFGTSVGAYLSQLRLEHARFLLSTTNFPVTDVAAQAGFADAGYFARVFKSSTGQTPREFRSQLNTLR